MHCNGSSTRVRCPAGVKAEITGVITAALVSHSPSLSDEQCQARLSRQKTKMGLVPG